MNKLFLQQNSVKRNEQVTTKRGFALLVAALVSGLFLAIGAVIFQIAYIELVLSQTGRDSQFAFYAADTGAECALYWERKYSNAGDDGSGSAFSVYDPVGFGSTGDGTTNSNREKILNDGSFSSISCSGVTINPPRAGGSDAGSVNFRQGATQGQTYFKFPVKDAAGTDRGCAEVTVSKLQGSLPGTDGFGVAPTITTILSRGYNTCDPNNINRVERAVQITLR